MSTQEHLVSRMRLNNGRVVDRIPSSRAHAYLGLDPAEVPWPALAYLMRERGWSGPRTLYIKNINGQQLARGFEREVSA